MELGSGCRLLTLADVETAAGVLARAFFDDPLCAYMLPLRRTRRRTLTTFFRIAGEVNIRGQRAFGAGHPLHGVAYWQQPDQPELSISIKAIGKLLPLLFTFYPIGYLRARAVIQRIDSLHKSYAAGPHYYLDNLGVLASARGQGVSSGLIRPFLNMADQQRVVAYTDTVTQSNVALYEHFGFRCVEASQVAGTGITVWAMRRPAAGASQANPP